MLPYMAKRDLADVFKLRLLRWENYPGSPGWAQCNHGVFIRGKKETESQRRRCKDESREERHKDLKLALKKREEVTSQERQAASRR